MRMRSYIFAGSKSPTRHSPAKAARRAGTQRYGDGASSPHSSAHTHVCDGIPANFHLNTIDRRRARAVKLVPLRSAPIQISGMLRHSKHAQVLRDRAQNPYASWSRDVDIPSLVGFHAVDDAAFENTVANLLRENAAVAERSVGRDIEHADMSSRGIVHVEKLFIGREAHAVGLAKVVRLQVQLAIGRNPKETLKTQILLTLQPKNRHPAVRWITEIDRIVGSNHHVVGAVQFFPLPMRCDDLALPRPGFHHQRAGVVLTDIQISCAVIGHAIALVARIADLRNPIGGAPSAAHVAGHITEVQALLLWIPDGTFGKQKPRAKFFDDRVLIDQSEQLRRLYFDGITHADFTPPEDPGSPTQWTLAARTRLL